MSREMVTLRRAISLWEGSLRAEGKARKTIRDYGDAMSRVSDFLGAETDPSTISVDDAEALLGTAYYGTLSPTTIGKEISAWRSFSEWGRRRRGWYDWARDLGRPKRAKPELRRLTRREVAAMLAATSADERDLTVVWLLAYTGARRDAARRVRFGDVDFHERTLRFPTDKGNKGRTIAIPRVLCAYLAGVRRLRGDEARDDCYVIPSAHEGNVPGGERYRHVDPRTPASSQTVWRAVKRVADAAGVRNAQEITPHMFRRFLLEDRDEAGITTITIAELAGHADVRTTAGYTGRAKLAAMRRAVDDVDFEIDEDPPLVTAEGPSPDPQEWRRRESNPRSATDASSPGGEQDPSPDLVTPPEGSL